MILGGAFGGALPDIDIEDSSIEKLGTKGANAAKKVTTTLSKATGGALYGPVSAINKVIGVIGLAINTIILVPMCKAWRWLAEHVFAKFYYFLYEAFGKKIGWDKSKPWTHRGGLTHSLLFMVLALIFLLPISLLFGCWDFLIGGELGIVSHLFADALCRSGVKFFWPWLPKVGYPRINEEGRAIDKGNGVRLMPFKWLVKTGCDRLRDDDLRDMPSEKRKEMRKLRRRERAWQRVFQILAILTIVLVIAGIGPGSGALALYNWGNRADTMAVQEDQADQQETQQTDEVAVSDQPAEPQSQPAPDNTEKVDPSALGVNGVNPVAREMQGETVPEIKGPTSLTFGDISIDELPVGIMKMPDESLWVVGVGPVTPENLDNPRWAFTDEEKGRVLIASQAGKVNELPSTIVAGANDALNAAGDATGDALDAAGGAAGDAINAAGTAVGDAANDVVEDAQESKSWLESLLGGDFHWGFFGITPYTQATTG